MDDNEQTRETYALFGLAIFMAQVLEHGLVSAMVAGRLPERSRVTRAEIDSFMDRQFENTLGTLLRELQKYVAVPNDLLGLLQRALRSATGSPMTTFARGRVNS